MEEKIVMNSALPDNRPEEKKIKDYSRREIVTAAIPTFTHSKITELTASVYNQWYVGSCVPHGFYTMLEYEGIVPKTGMSQLRLYRKRINYPQPGSVGVDILDNIRSGQSLQSEFPTPVGFTEAKAEAMAYIEGLKLIKDFNYFQHLDTNGKQDFTLIPSDIAAGKAVAIFIYATEEEWAQEYVKIKTPNLKLDQAEVRHCVCLIPLGDFKENNKRWLSVHDSAKFGNRHLRYIQDEFLLKRAYFSVVVFPKNTPNPEPLPVFQKPLIACEQNQSGQAVRNLQTFLVTEKKLDAQYVTGFYGALTAKAVLWWQLEHWERFSGGVPQLLEYAGKYWGQQSINIIK